MDEAQFIRVEAHPAAKVDGIVGEAMREDGYVSHLAEPGEPVVLFGSPREFRQRVRAQLDAKVRVRSRRGNYYERRLRPDTRCIVSIVASYPVPCVELGRSCDEVRRRTAHWVRDVLEFVREEFDRGTADLAVLHLDEPRPHLHILLPVPAKTAHPGLRAEYRGGRRIADGKERVRRYREAMRDFLDRFWHRVGRKHHQRRGDYARKLQRIKHRPLFEAARRVVEIYRITRDPELGKRLDDFFLALAPPLRPLPGKAKGREENRIGIRVASRSEAAPDTTQNLHAEVHGEHELGAEHCLLLLEQLAFEGIDSSPPPTAGSERAPDPARDEDPTPRTHTRPRSG